MKLTFMKHAETEKNRIIIPKLWIKKFGREMFLEIDLKTGIITITPITKEV